MALVEGQWTAEQVQEALHDALESTCTDVDLRVAPDRRDSLQVEVRPKARKFEECIERRAHIVAKRILLVATPYQFTESSCSMTGVNDEERVHRWLEEEQRRGHRKRQQRSQQQHRTGHS